jgi:hypothetical protein
VLRLPALAHGVLKTSRQQPSALLHLLSPAATCGSAPLLALVQIDGSVMFSGWFTAAGTGCWALVRFSGWLDGDAVAY